MQDQQYLKSPITNQTIRETNSQLIQPQGAIITIAQLIMMLRVCDYHEELPINANGLIYIFIEAVTVINVDHRGGNESSWSLQAVAGE